MRLTSPGLRFCLCLLIAISTQARADAGGKVPEAVSQGGLRGELFIAPLEANRLRDVTVRLARPIRPEAVNLTVGHYVARDDGREAFFEVQQAVPFAFVSDSEGMTQELFIQAGGLMGNRADERTLKIFFCTEKPNTPDVCAESLDSLTFVLTASDT